jgi:parvulin-like peptidyl-prolyl isomerase
MALSINGDVIDDTILAQEADQLRAQMRDMLQKARSAEQRSAAEAQVQNWARENVIRRVLLQQAAAKSNDEVPEEELTAATERLKQQYGGDEQFEKCMNVTPANFEQMQSDLQMQLKTDLIIRRVTAKVAKPKQGDVADFYRKHKAHFVQPEQVRVRHIVKHVNDDAEREPARAALEQSLSDVQAGASFEEIAERDSDCKGNGGDLGYFPRGQMVEAFDHVVFELEEGAVSDIFETEFGYHIAQLVDRQPEKLATLQEARLQIEQQLMNQKRRNVLDNYIEGLKAKAEIQDV